MAIGFKALRRFALPIDEGSSPRQFEAGLAADGGAGRPNPSAGEREAIAAARAQLLPSSLVAPSRDSATVVDRMPSSYAGDGGDNSITGTDGDDYFDLSQGGNDSAFGLGGNDGFYFAAAFTGADHVDGGAGTNDQIGLQGDYTGANKLVMDTDTITDVEAIVLLPGFSYDITLHDSNVAPAAVLKVQATQLAAGQNFTFNGAAETNSDLIVYGGLGTDIITTGARNDGAYFGPGRFDPAVDRFDGGGGANDQIGLDGDYTLVFDGTAIVNVEAIVMLPGPAVDPNNFNLTVTDAQIGLNQELTLWGALVDTSIVVDCSAETNGRVRIYGGHVADTLTGGAADDFFWGGLGGDTLKGNAGFNAFYYESVAESTGSSYDRIDGFVSGTDRIDLQKSVNAIDPTVVGGALNSASFNADLAAAITADQLHFRNAVLFKPDSGTLAGTTFLIIETNGVAGYQADLDHVIQLTNPPAIIAVGDFV